MTPTEEKAIIKAKELIDFFQLHAEKGLGKINWLLPKKIVISQAIKLCDQVIETLNSMKGMGKIHKVKFWKLVKKYLEEYK